MWSFSGSNMGDGFGRDYCEHWHKVETQYDLPYVHIGHPLHSKHFSKGSSLSAIACFSYVGSILKLSSYTDCKVFESVRLSNAPPFPDLGLSPVLKLGFNNCCLNRLAMLGFSDHCCLENGHQFPNKNFKYDLICNCLSPVGHFKYSV